MQVLSHRGYWKTADEKNTPAAFERSFKLGFGTETDFRDLNGRLVISHDPPTEGALSAEAFFEIYNTFGKGLPLAMNIKADGLQPLVRALLDRFAVTNYFLFDMSIPDTLVSFRKGFSIFTRQSEYEPQPAFIEKAGGIWLDAFEGEWYPNTLIEGHLKAGKAVCIVSPDLHKRPYGALWERLKLLAHHARLMLCTDVPEEAKVFFNA